MPGGRPSRISCSRRHAANVGAAAVPARGLRVGRGAVDPRDVQGRSLIVTGFYVRRGGRPRNGRTAWRGCTGSALGAFGREVIYVTDRFSKRVVEAVVGDGRVIEFPIAGHDESRACATELLERIVPRFWSQSNARVCSATVPTATMRVWSSLTTTPRPTTSSCCTRCRWASVTAAMRSGWVCSRDAIAPRPGFRTIRP